MPLENQYKGKKRKRYSRLPRLLDTRYSAKWSARGKTNLQFSTNTPSL